MLTHSKHSLIKVSASNDKPFCLRAGFFHTFLVIKTENDEDIGDDVDYITYAVCKSVNCHYFSRGQFGNIFQMRILFDLYIPLLRIISKEIIG